MSNTETKIGINIGKAAKKDRGISVYTKNILQEIQSIGGNHKITFMHYPGSPPDPDLITGNAKLMELPYSDKTSPIKTIFNEQVLNPIQQAKSGLDVIWHPHNRSQFFSPVAYACTMHDVLPIARPDLAGNYLNFADKKLLFMSRTRSAKNADLVITVSEFSRQEIISHLNVQPDKVIAIHSGIDKNTFRPDHSAENWARVKNTYSLPNEYLFTAGSYAPHKNLQCLVDAYSKSELPNKGVGLVMVGPNDATGYRIGYQQLEKHIEESNLANKVRLLSSVSEADLVTIYSHATLFALTSLYEGFGFTALEAMACEVPVIASCLTAIPEVCESAALYADPNHSESFAQQFNLLLDDTNLQKRQIEKGKKQIRKFTWKECAKNTLDALISAAKRRGGSI